MDVLSCFFSSMDSDCVNRRNHPTGKSRMWYQQGVDISTEYGDGVAAGGTSAKELALRGDKRIKRHDDQSLHTPTEKKEQEKRDVLPRTPVNSYYCNSAWFGGMSATRALAQLTYEPKTTRTERTEHTLNSTSQAVRFKEGATGPQWNIKTRSRHRMGPCGPRDIPLPQVASSVLLQQY